MTHRPMPAKSYSPRQLAVRFAGVVLGYMAAAWMGWFSSLQDSHATLIWLPAGVALAALLRYGNVMLLAVMLAATTTNLYSLPLLLSMHIALGSTLAIYVCYLILREIGFRHDFGRRRDVIWFGIAAIVSMCISATNGVIALGMNGLHAPFSQMWMSWWAGDAIGVLLATPLLLTFCSQSWKKLSYHGKEALGFVLVLGLTNWLIFIEPAHLQLHLTFLSVAVLVWAAMRFGMSVTSLAVLLSSTMAAWATANGKGPFTQSGEENLLIMWGYITTLVVITLMIAALQAESLNAALEVREAYERIRKVASRLPGLILQYRIHADRTITVPYASDALQSMFEMTLEELQKDFRQIYKRIDRHDIEAGKLALAIATPSRGAWQNEFRIRRLDGSVRWLYIDALPEYEADGSTLWHCFISDVTERKQSEKDLQIAAYTFESQEGIFVADARWRILRLNHAFTRITGYAADDLVGKLPPMYKRKHQDRAFFEQIDASLKEHRFWQGELWAPRKNGEIYPQMITLTAIADGRGDITNYIASFNDISRHKDYEEEIRNLAFYDSLTQLPNRRLLMDRLEHLISKNNRNEMHSAILFIDLDNFKTINDTHGHDAGDILLIETASRLQTCVRDSDTVARLGGDEFVVVLEDLSVNKAEAVTQADRIGTKIRQRLAQPYRVMDFEYHGSSSIGVALFHGSESTVKDLFKRADTAMYEAKTSGRNALRFFDPAMQAVLIVRMMLESNLRIALSHNQFELHYQVQVDAFGNYVGAEALIRWDHPDRGHVAPIEFIPLAEETGLIVPIGLWVLDTACAQLKRWESNPKTADMVLAVNVSAKQFQQADFVETLTETVARHGINPSRLEIELTESTILDNVDKTTVKMQELRKLGIAFSMDDFGTGYSSLAYLQRLPLNQLKIDKSFVRDLSVDENDATIVRAIISLGINLGLKVIAEGVETEAQLDFLIQHHCHAFQGYLFSQPLSSAAFDAFLLEPKHRQIQSVIA